MSLEPCKVCGTLNPESAEECLSCGHPPQGPKRPLIFRWIAIALVICFALPFLSGIVNWVLFQLQSDPPPPQPQVSQYIGRLGEVDSTASQ